MIFSPEAAMKGGDALFGPVLAHLHALSAVSAANSFGMSPASAYRRTIFLIDGYPDDFRSEPGRLCYLETRWTIRLKCDAALPTNER